MSGFISESVRFGIVGVANTAVGLSVIFGSIFLFNADPVIANASGYVLGFFFSFIFNKFWTFGDIRSSAKSLPSFLIAASISYLLNLLVVILITLNFGLSPYLVQIFGMAVYTLSMFFGCRLFVFKAERRDLPLFK